MALRSLKGAFSQHIHELVDDLITLRMLVEATLDFPEEDIDFLEAADARGKLQALQGRLKPCSPARNKARFCAKA